VIPEELVNAAVSRAFAECWGQVDVRRELVPLTALRSTLRLVRRERLSHAHTLLEHCLGHGPPPYPPVRYAAGAVALGVIAESYGRTAVLLDGTNRAVAALRRGCRAIAVTMVRPRLARPPVGAVVTLTEVDVWTRPTPRPELFRDADETLFRPMPDILARAERELLEKLIEEERDGTARLHLGRAGRLAEYHRVAP
jgi:hypothetical protein